MELMTREATAPARQAPVVSTPDYMIQLAIEKNADIDKLEKLMELKLKWDATEARKAYVGAMAAFKRNPPDIIKNKGVGYITREGDFVGYKHATLDHICEKIDEALAEHGLSFSWKTHQLNGFVEVTCVITHELGHQEATSLACAPDTSGKKNAIQSIGSAVTYLQRYTLLAALGLAASDRDADDDGAASNAPANEPERITAEQAELLRKLSVEAGDSPEYLLQAADLQRLEDMEADRFEGAVNHLKNRKAHREKLQAEQSAAAAGPTTSQPSAQGIFSGGAQ